ncbi:MAG: choice-of-anchor D domain-containing protein [Candidatus Acidiferrales bacterium]
MIARAFRSSRSATSISASIVAFCFAVVFLASSAPASAQSRVVQKWLATVKDPAQSLTIDPQQEWSSLVNDATANSSGGVTVAGYICTSVNSSGNCSNEQFTIETYNASGKQLWDSFISSAGNQADATQVISDSAGDIYAAGWEQNANGTQSMLLVKYSPSGTREWIRYYGYYQNASVTLFGPGAIAVDAQDDVFVVGYGPVGTGFNVTFKFSPAGQLLWMSSLDDSDGLFPGSQATAMILDSSEDVYIAFNDFQNGGVLLKYGPDGKVLWDTLNLGEPPDPDSKGSLALDSSGNIYMEGSWPYNPGQTGNQAIAAKFTPAGTQLWESTAAPTCTNNADLGYGSTINVDRDGNSYLTSGNCSGELMVTKYDPSGNALWQKSYTGTSISTPIASYMNGSGDLYVLATTGANVDSATSDYLTVKYDTSGKLQWATTFKGLNNTPSNEPIAMTASGGDLFVTGTAGPSVDNPTSWATIDYVQDAADATPTGLAFSSQAVDTTSAPQSVTLKNTSTEDLDINSIKMAGPFSETNNCSSEMVADGSCTIQITFTPTSTGAQTSSLSIYDQWAGSPDVVKLTGSGVQ